LRIFSTGKGGEHTIALVVMALFVWQNNAELIITTGSQALSSSGAQKKKSQFRINMKIAVNLTYKYPVIC
jgi:hypothetical protein